jgi:hypothetical protein
VIEAIIWLRKSIRGDYWLAGLKLFFGKSWPVPVESYCPRWINSL